ncbi:fimbrial protein [Enterobacter sp. CC120223-11]|uniref:fimbrial protein n=1 Tax=Enterobacter sp. CC120223-11 TaxID=1378073 RepID=UPI000BCF4247|nr:fimbrial protein [Enterobacter sp. CC120223-11]SNY75335.1 Pilin (type 1 fimbria component protein) [Enterobacter sp. CC120223-11]
MKLNKIVLGLTMTFSLISMANAADSGHGTVTFTGSVTEAPCSIDPENVDQTIELGQVSAAALSKGGKSSPQNFTIKLTNCDISEKKSVSAKFTGAEGGTQGSLGITGTAKGASIGITDGSGNVIALNKDSAVQNMQAGNHDLTFAAYLQGDAVDGEVTPGDFKGVTNFTLAYQ